MSAPVTVRELLVRRFGTYFTPESNRVASTVGTTSTEVLRGDPSRVGFLFVNLSLNNIFLSPIGAASATNGIRLDPNGGSVSVEWEEDGEVVAWPWQAVADGAGSAFLALETRIAPTAPTASE